MSKKAKNNIIEFYKCNRQEITSIFSSSIILLVITILSGIFSYFLLNKKVHDSIDTLVLSIIIFFSGILLCMLYKQIITLGWVNFQIENELGLQKFGSEHKYFIERSKFGIIGIWFYNLICANCFISKNKIFYHTNLKIIIGIIFLSNTMSSFMLYKYLDKSLPCQQENNFWALSLSVTIYLVLLIISFLFFRNEFKTSQKNIL